MRTWSCVKSDYGFVVMRDITSPRAYNTMFLTHSPQTWFLPLFRGKHVRHFTPTAFLTTSDEVTETTKIWNPTTHVWTSLSPVSAPDTLALCARVPNTPEIFHCSGSVSRPYGEECLVFRHCSPYSVRATNRSFTSLGTSSGLFDFSLSTLLPSSL